MFADRTNWNLEANVLSREVTRYRAAGKGLIDLTASNPTECGFKYDLGAILQAVANPGARNYSPEPKGLAVAREAVAQYYAARKIALPIDDIVLTTSTSEAYSFVFRMLCNPGDEILIPEPSYPLFAFLAEIQDVALRRYPLIYDYGWQIDFHRLEGTITDRTRAAVVVHPNNPTGHFTKLAEIEKLNRICAEHNLAVIADEVFLDFALGDELQTSFAVDSPVLTFTTSGLSKISGLPQMKAAWLITSGPEQLKSRALERLEVIADTYLSMNTPVQLAMPVLLAQRHVFHEQVMARVRNNLAELDRQLVLQKICSRLELEAGWYALLRVPATKPDEDLAIDLLNRKGIYVHPGHFYDFPADGFLVLSLITKEEDFATGVKLLLSIFPKSEEERRNVV
ncbi:MAG: pyridoxal phosphate-dependent aminotransferase [Candidatus Acidiferrales bacterium]